MKRKSLYLILAATVVAVTCEPQRTNNDIIWYPVDDEDGVFISTIGEKYRTTQQPKWRSHRIPRHSEVEAPLTRSYDPSENYDPSFFNNIHNRRPFVGNSAYPKVPTAFYNQYPNSRPHKRPQAQANQIPNNEYEEIIIEVYDYTKQPSGNWYPGNRPNNQWNNRPVAANQNQWGNNPFFGNTNQWGNVQRPSNQWGGVQRPSNQWGGVQIPSNQWGGVQRPSNQWGSGQTSSNQFGAGQTQSSQWGGTSGAVDEQPGAGILWGGSSGSPSGGQQQGTSNQWGGGQTQSNQWGGTSGSVDEETDGGNLWGSSGSSGQQQGTSNQWSSGSRPVEKPPTTQLIEDPIRRPESRPNGSKRPSGQSDKLVFPEETLFTTSTPSTTVPIDLIPTDPPTRSPCEVMCPVTPEFNPVCGTDSVTYSNAGRLKCAQTCGKNVRLSHYGSCGRTPFNTPLVSNNPLLKYAEFW